MERVGWGADGAGDGHGRKVRAARRGAVVVALGALLASLAAPGPARAQANARTEFTVLGINALLGGVTSGTAALVRGRPFFRAFGLGLAGGTLVYGGKRFASWYGVPGSGIAGRFFAAVGASMIRNGAAGRGAFDLVLLPVGPLTLYLRPENDTTHAPVKLSLVRAALLTALIIREDFRLDPRATLHAGTPIFDMRDGVVRQTRGSITLGLALAGVVMLSDLDDRRLRGRIPRGALIAHERVHVVQDDFAEIAWAGPLEGWLLGQLPGGAWLRRYVEPGLLGLAGAALALWAGGGEGPWEWEADYMESAWGVGP
ncbi:MAG TPA: hypothetical protein VF192_06050 [Longimicrobiales bacterium]